MAPRRPDRQPFRTAAASRLAPPARADARTPRSGVKTLVLHPSVSTGLPDPPASFPELPDPLDDCDREARRLFIRRAARQQPVADRGDGQAGRVLVEPLDVLDA